MSRATRFFLCVILGLFLVVGITACGSDSAEEVAVEEVAEETPAAEVPLPSEPLYKDVVALGLAHSYDLTLDDGTYEVWQNLEGYGVVRWTDEEGREIIVTRRYLENEPEEWVYSDESIDANGVTDVSPTGAQLQAWDALANEILMTTGTSGDLTRSYAWTSESGISTVAYSTAGVSDDPNLNISLGPDESLGRFTLTIR